MKKTLLFISCLSFSTLGFSATIENRNLSTPTANTTDQSQQNMQIWELKQQIQQLQTQVRQLVGKIEEKDYQFEQLNNEIENRYKDLDQRIQILNEQLNPPEVEAETTENSATTPSAPAASTPTPTTKQENQPINVSTGSDQDAYNLAYEAYQTGGASQAIQPMQNVIDSFPNSPYVSHAHYWLGEFNLQLNPQKVHEAKDNFEVVAGNYPKSSKAPAALYRLIEIALNIDKDINKARGFYQQLIQKYPDSQETKTARNTFAL